MVPYARGEAYREGIVPPFVVRLDTIPHFNPNMIGKISAMLLRNMFFKVALIQAALEWY